jgi:hypothetical protein
VEKPLVTILSPLLKSIFRWNHDWTMKRGERQIAEQKMGVTEPFFHPTAPQPGYRFRLYLRKKFSEPQSPG